jgi:hypothetical protein
VTEDDDWAIPTLEGELAGLDPDDSGDLIETGIPGKVVSRGKLEEATANAWVGFADANGLPRTPVPKLRYVPAERGLTVVARVEDGRIVGSFYTKAVLA